MNLTEDKTLQNHAKQCEHFLRNTLLSYEYDYTCVACRYNVKKQKMDSVNFQGKKVH